MDAVITELLDFGSNTFWYQKGYGDVLDDVLDKMDVPKKGGIAVDRGIYQHFAMWCKTGLRESRQIARLLDKLQDLALRALGVRDFYRRVEV